MSARLPVCNTKQWCRWSFRSERNERDGFNPAILGKARYCHLGDGEAKLPREKPSREYTSAHEGNTSRIAPGEVGAITSSSVLTGR